MDITSELLEQCIRDDRRAIQRLYESCFNVLMPVCCRYHKNEEDARSSFNLGFIKIIKGLEKAGTDINFGAWSKRVMVNTLIDEYRKRKNYESHVAAKETERELEVAGGTKVNEAENNMGYENIMKLVEQLPEITSKVFNLYVIEGYSHKEIANMLEMSEGTSKWHLSTGRKMLRELLEDLEKEAKRMVV